MQGVKVPDKLEKEKRTVKLTRMDLGTTVVCDEGSSFPCERFQETKRGYCSCGKEHLYERWDKH